MPIFLVTLTTNVDNNNAFSRTENNSSITWIVLCIIKHYQTCTLSSIVTLPLLGNLEFKWETLSEGEEDEIAKVFVAPQNPTVYLTSKLLKPHY